MSDGAALELVQTLSGHTDRVWALAWSPAGDMLASCGGDRTVRIWSCHGEAHGWCCDALLEEEEHDRTIRSITWSPDGRYLATASFDASTAIWRVENAAWELVATLEGHENEVKSVAWSPTGTLIATCGRDRSVWIWESLPDNEFEVVDVKQGHSQDVKMVAWHPDGELLASASYDDSIKLWRDVGDEWECIQTLSGPGLGHSSTVWALAFNPSGSKMVSCSDDTSLKIWYDTKGKLGWKLEQTLTGHHSRTVFSVDWSAADRIASGAGDNSICVYERQEQQQQQQQQEALAAGAVGQATAAAGSNANDTSASRDLASVADAAATPGTDGSPAAPAGGEHGGAATQEAGHDHVQQQPQHAQMLFQPLVLCPNAHAADVNCVRWHPTDHYLLASAGDDHDIKLWQLHA